MQTLKMRTRTAISLYTLADTTEKGSYPFFWKTQSKKGYDPFS
jgi:hypothetical protein